MLRLVVLVVEVWPPVFEQLGLDDTKQVQFLATLGGSAELGLAKL